MLLPKNTKFRKQRKGKIKGVAKGNASLNFGEFGLKALQAERITSRQIEASRRAITRFMKRQGKLWINIFPHTPVTKKPLEVRQGKGKGSVEFWAAKVKPGVIMFELGGVTEEVARGAFERAAAKLPIKTKFVKRVD
jgi:large subunit ribosomal protein L16